MVETIWGEIISNYECGACGFIYNEEEWEDTPFNELKNTWKCPICFALKKNFFERK